MRLKLLLASRRILTKSAVSSHKNCVCTVNIILRSRRCLSDTRNVKTDIAPKSILGLHQRGIFEDIFPPASVHLPDQLTKKQCFYCGFDPTADSLHVGNLLSLMALMHCQRAGHDVISLIGTATAATGDPSGHTKDRKVLSKETIAHNAKSIALCIKRIFENHALHLFENRQSKNLPSFKIVYNHTWYNKLPVMDFFSAACRNFRVGPMLEKRYIRDRIDSLEGLSLAEFLYQILQAYDWKHLHKNFNCRFQIGGLDQLGNISAGHHLIRRHIKEEVYGLLTPLVTTPRGDKLGKSAGNSVWLCPKKTSPFEFYQYFYRQQDSVVESFLKYFTFIELKQIEEIMIEHRENPHRQKAQIILARNACKIVHGEEGLKSAELCTRVLYEGRLDDIEKLSEDEIAATFSGTEIIQGVLEPHTTVYDLAATIAKAIPSGYVGENLIRAGGLRINGQVVDFPHEILMADVHVLKNDLTLLTVGKKRHFIIRWKLPRLEHEDVEEDEKPNQEIPGVDVDQLTKIDPEIRKME